jgi:hypothetical protein
MSYARIPRERAGRARNACRDKILSHAKRASDANSRAMFVIGTDDDDDDGGNGGSRCVTSSD